MKVSYGLPVHRVEAGPDLVGGAAIAELAAAAEAAGFSAAYVTDHPFPPADWVSAGGHHSLDQFVALATAAAATTVLGLHTHLLVLPYQNPFLAAKAVASLDVVSGGRVLLGVGTGYLEAEFEALGADFARRNDAADEALRAMIAAWRGEPLEMDGAGWRATGNASLPRPVQSPHPPVWVGGNSRRAVRRAVELGDGWSPFAVARRGAASTRTAAITGPADLAPLLDHAAEHAAAIGRTAPLEVVFTPSQLAMGVTDIDHGAVVAECEELASMGVGWVSAALPGSTRADQRRAIDAFGEKVVSRLNP